MKLSIHIYKRIQIKTSVTAVIDTCSTVKLENSASDLDILAFF